MCSLDDALWRLYYLSRLHDDPRAVWVHYVVERYVNTGRAGAAYCKALRSLDDKGLQALIEKGLHGSMDDDSILRRVNKLLQG